MSKCPFSKNGECRIDCELYREYCPYVDKHLQMDESDS
ncbi:MAG: hypothetical protein BWY47_01854 [Bacteroidetes bacterium ADurb.Bin302]|nr:MAG: hypothetical protein BWY47_01854 [Bacteroidetes bacterium ADurb.Bin302]